MATFERTGTLAVGNAGYVKARTGTIGIGIPSPPGIVRTGIMAIGSLVSPQLEDNSGTVVAIAQFGGSRTLTKQRTGATVQGGRALGGTAVKVSGGAPDPVDEIPGGWRGSHRRRRWRW